MDVQGVLSYAVTLLGWLLCVFSAAFMLRGKPMPGDRGSPQVIKYKGLEVRTSAIILLLAVSVVVAVLPLFLLARYPRPVTPPPLLAPRPPVKLWISGRVEDESGRGLSGATVTLGDNKEVKAVDGDGSFNFTVTLAEGERLKLRTEKQGYRPQNLVLGLDFVIFPATLVQSREHQ